MLSTPVRTKISRQGQVTLPKQIRANLGFEKDTLVNMSVENGKVIISKITNPVAKFNGIFKKMGIKLTAQEFIKIRKEEAKLA